MFIKRLAEKRQLKNLTSTFSPPPRCSLFTSAKDFLTLLTETLPTEFPIDIPLKDSTFADWPSLLYLLKCRIDVFEFAGR